MREGFNYEGTSTGEYKDGLYVTYDGEDYPAAYLGMGRFVLYSEQANEHFTFPTADGRYLLQTDTRDELLTKIWDYGFDGESRTVDVHVRTLRSKLGECGKFIETVRGIGYRFGGKSE